MRVNVLQHAPMRDQVRFKIGVMSIIMKCLFIIQQILVFYQL